MVTDPVAGEMRIFRGKIVSYGKALYQRCVWTEIAVLRVGDLKLAALGIELGKHHPRYQDHVSCYEYPIGYARARRPWEKQLRWI